MRRHSGKHSVNDLPFLLENEISFPGAFTGTAYLAEMIDNEDVYRRDLR